MLASMNLQEPGPAMPNQVFDEIRKSVAASIDKGVLLRIPVEAERIARCSGASARLVAEHLVEAGIRAHVNIEFGAPRRLAG
jgi:hypothetical protein